MTRWMTLLLFGLASCAGPKVGLPIEQASSDDPAVVAEQGIEQQLSYDNYLKHFEALWRVGDKLEVASAELCRGHAGYAAGFHVVTLATTDERYRAAARARFPELTKAAIIAYVDPGSAAERAGFSRGDGVLAVNGNPVPSDSSAQAAIDRAFAETSNGLSHVKLSRGGQTLTIAVPGILACSYPIQAVASNKINSYTDATGIYIFDGMIAATHSDDELAVIIGHEMGHNISGQIAAGLGAHLELAFSGNAAVVPLEEQADYVGLYAMARAGYDVNAAPSLWRRLAATEMPDFITAASDHPTFPVRIVMLHREIAEIDTKMARGAPLVPETMPGGGKIAPVAAAAPH